MRTSLTKIIHLCLVFACGLMAGTIHASAPTTRSVSVEVRLKKIGEYLCRQVIAGTVEKLKGSRNVPDVVRVGQNLPGVLADMRQALMQGYTVEVQIGEPGQIKDERVTHCILIRCDHDAICLRMGYDATLDSFHIVGYCGASPLLPDSSNSSAAKK
jgi:hypothetical protein